MAIRPVSLMSMLAIIAILLLVGPVRSASSVSFDGFGFIDGSSCFSPPQDPGYCKRLAARMRQQQGQEGQEMQQMQQQEMQRQQQQWDQRQQNCRVVPLPGTAPTLSSYQIQCR